MADASSLFTTVKNPLGTPRTYGYLPYHGKTLASGVRFSFFGDLYDYIGAGKPTHKRWTDALQNDLKNGKIEIISTPRPVLKDAVTKDIKVLNLSAAALGTSDPSWGAYNDT